MIKDKRSVLAGALIGVLASVVALGVGLVSYDWDPGDIASYEWSHGVASLLGDWSLVAGAGVLLFLIRYEFIAYLVSSFAVLLPMLLAIGYECVRFPTSHNLIPFELLVLLLCSAVLHFPSLVVWLIHRWFTRS